MYVCAPKEFVAMHTHANVHAINGYMQLQLFCYDNCIWAIPTNQITEFIYKINGSESPAQVKLVIHI